MIHIHLIEREDLKEGKIETDLITGRHLFLIPDSSKTNKKHLQGFI